MARRILFSLTGILASHPALAGGLPQLDTSTYASQLFWLFVCFTALYVLMSKIALPRVSEVLETRRLHKGGDLEKAAQLSEEAGKIRTTYEKSLATAQQQAADAMTSAGQAISEKISEEQSRFAENSRKRLVAAEQNIVKAKAEALQSLADISAEIAAEMVHKIADIQVNKADAKKHVMSVMQKG
jgi:F-type H+-transporting ATPase subunit b